MQDRKFHLGIVKRPLAAHVIHDQIKTGSTAHDAAGYDHICFAILESGRKGSDHVGRRLAVAWRHTDRDRYFSRHINERRSRSELKIVDQQAISGVHIHNRIGANNTQNTPAIFSAKPMFSATVMCGYSA